MARGSSDVAGRTSSSMLKRTGLCPPRHPQGEEEGGLSRKACVWGPTRVATAAAIAGGRGGVGSSRGSYSRENTLASRHSMTGRPCVYLAACSLALLAFMSDPGASFQAAAPVGARGTRDNSRKHPRAHAPCREPAGGELLHGSFTGRLDRESRQRCTFWGLGWTCAPPRQGPLEATPSTGGGVGSESGGSGVTGRTHWGVKTSRGRGRSTLGRRRRQGGVRGREEEAAGVYRHLEEDGRGAGALRAVSPSMGGASSFNGSGGGGGSSSSRREAHRMVEAPLKEIGWPPSPSDASASGGVSSSTVEVFPVIMEALSCFKRIAGHVNIPPRFEVPDDVSWPEDLRGMQLGRKIQQLRNEKLMYMKEFPERVQLLRNLGFEWDEAALPDEWERIRCGLETYYQKFQHVRVPVRFVVPSESSWPEEIWGHKLGSRVAQIRQSGRFLGDTEEEREDRWAVLAKLGFERRLRFHNEELYGDGTQEEFEVLCEALEVYRSLGGFVPNLPPNFVVPNSDPWPMSTRAFPLGEEVRAVRSRQKYVNAGPDFAERLVALDVPITPMPVASGPAETRFEKVVTALETYKHVFGHVRVQATFEVPREEPWPEWTWGMKLGRSLTNIVTKGTFMRGFPERRTRLSELGFDTDPKGIWGFKDVKKTEHPLRNDVTVESEKVIVDSQPPLDLQTDPPSPPSLGPKKGLELSREVEPEPVKARDRETSATSRELLSTVMESLRSRGNRNPTDAIPEDPIEVFIKQQEMEELEDNRDGGTGLTRGLMTLDPSPFEGTGLHMDVKPPPTGAGSNSPTHEMMLQYAKENRARRERGKPKMGRTDLRYWPEHTQHIVASEQIVQLGHLAQGFPDVAVVDGPLGTNMVALPGRISPTEFDPKRKKVKYGASDDDVDYEDDGDAFGVEVEEGEVDVFDDGGTGLIDRQRGRRLLPGMSTAAAGLMWLSEEEREHVVRVGFEWDEFGDGFLWEDVERGLLLYRDLYGELPRDNFLVPNDPEWPRELAGMHLGSFCRQLRIGDIWAKHDPTRRNFLDSVDFDWGNDDLYLYFQWPEVVITFYSVQILKGHLDVLPDYTIPEEDPWPLPIRGQPVGFLLNVIRQQKELLMEHYPERFSILRGLGIEWVEPTFVDWQEPEYDTSYQWRGWGHVKAYEDDPDMAIGTEVGYLEPRGRALNEEE